MWQPLASCLVPGQHGGVNGPAPSPGLELLPKLETISDDHARKYFQPSSPKTMNVSRRWTMSVPVSHHRRALCAFHKIRPCDTGIPLYLVARCTNLVDEKPMVHKQWLKLIASTLYCMHTCTTGMDQSKWFLLVTFTAQCTDLTCCFKYSSYSSRFSLRP